MVAAQQPPGPLELQKIGFRTYLGGPFTVRLPCAQLVMQQWICTDCTKNRVKKQFFEAVPRVIDRHDVSTTQGYPCRPPGTDAGGLPAARTDMASKITFWLKL